MRPPPEIAATAYIVTDLHSKQTLASNNADAPIEPAALTQMMTAYLAFKALENGTLEASQMLTVSNAAWKVEGSRMFLDPKVPVSVSSLIKGTTIQSANDAAITLAEAIGNGSIDEFVKQMNEEAKRLGMKHTHFNNPTGISSNGHVSTVGDLAILAAALINDYPKYYPLFANKSFKYNNIEQPARASESSKLLNWALQAFDTPKLYNGGEVISQVKVYKGSTKAVDIGFLDDVYITIPHDTGKNVKPILETLQPVLAPIEKGQVLGKLKVMKDGKVIAEKDVVALTGVEEGSWLRRMWDAIVLWFKGLFS